MKRLFLVRCRGMQADIGGSPGHGTAFVVAEGPTEAYERVRDDLLKRDIGHESDRVLKSVELVAEAQDYSDIMKLYL